MTEPTGAAVGSAGAAEVPAFMVLVGWRLPPWLVVPGGAVIAQATGLAPAGRG